MISDRWKKICDEIIAQLSKRHQSWFQGALYRKDWIHTIYNICLESISNPSLRESEAIFKYLKYYEFFATDLYTKKDKIIFRISKTETVKFKLEGKVHYDTKTTHLRLPWHRQGETPGEIKERDFYRRKIRSPEPISPSIVKLTASQKRAVDQSAQKGTHICQRCGSVIAGKGRHGKKRRGHTQEVCDFFMAKNIMKS
jgi:hypothetical protein